MTTNDVPRTSGTSSSTRRRSIFEDECEKQMQDLNEIFMQLPGISEEEDVLNHPEYPEGYVDKVTSEISEWKVQVEKALAENEKFKSEIQELKNMAVSEDILTVEQFDFFDSVSFDSYLRKAKDFCDRAEIFMHMHQYKPETEAEHWYRAAQKKIQENIEKK